MLGPNTITAGGENAVGIDGVLDGFVETAQRMIVERIGIHDGVLVGGRGAVLAPAVLGGDADQVLERLAVLLVGGNVVRNGKTKEKNKRARPIGGGKAERENGQAVILGGLREYFVGFEYGLASARNDGRKPDMAVPRRGIVGRARADRKHFEAGNAELGLVDLAELLGRERELVGFAGNEFGSGDGGELFLAVFPLGGDGLGGAVK